MTIPPLFQQRLKFNQQDKFIALTVASAFAISVILVLVKNLAVGMFGGLMVLISAIAYRYPRLGLRLLLLYLPFVGTVCYGISATYQPDGGYIFHTKYYFLWQISKDFLYFPAAIAMIISVPCLKSWRKQYQNLSIALLSFLIVCLLNLVCVNLPQQLVNQSGEQTLLVGIIGLKVTLGYVPLIICGYCWVREERDLRWLIRTQVAIALICCSLCLVQYSLLVNGICISNATLPHPATYKPSLQARCLVGGSLLYHARANLISLPGTFVAPWQWAWFLISSSFFTYGAVLYESSRLWRSLSCLAVVLVLVTAIISGQTTATILVPIVLLVLLLLAEAKPKPLKSILIACLGFAIVSQVSLLRNHLYSAIERWNYSPPDRFVISQFQWIFHQYLTLLGQGLGKATIAARSFGEIVPIETFYPKLLYEIGWLGALVFLIVVSLVSWQAVKIYFFLSKRSLKNLALCLACFIALISYNTFYYPLAVDPVAIYYWFFAGVLLKLPEVKEN
jgi:hypothetical protein